MNINEIATACADRIDPSLKRRIDAHASATHPEIVYGRKAMIEQRERVIEIIEMAIADAVIAERMVAEYQRMNPPRHK